MLKTDQPSLPIWILNLKRDTEKRVFMEKQLEKFGVQYRIIEAIDGRTLRPDELKPYSKEIALRDFGRELTPGELGCALSHIKMWNQMIKEHLDEVLILEDDIHVGRALFDVLAEREKLPDDYQHINFSTNAKQMPFGEFITDIYRASNHLERPYSTCAYLLTLAGAQYLLKLANPLYMPIDNFISISGIRSYGIYPKVVVLSEMESTIGRRWDNMPETGFCLRKFREFKNILKSAAIFVGFSESRLIKIHLQLNRLLSNKERKRSN